MKTKTIKLITLNFLLTLLLLGCEKDYDNVIDTLSPDYQVKLVSPSDSILYNPVDSLITIKIAFNSASNIQSVYCDVYSVDNNKINSNPLSLLDNGNLENGDDTENDGTFSNKIPFSESYPNGIYNVKYFVIDNSGKSIQVAIANFIFNNGKPNVPPQITDDIVSPDSAVVTAPIVILTSVKASDTNGYLDIEKVYFLVYRPNGTTSNNQNTMFDDGNIVDHGDQVAGDGIYSLLIQITPANTKGTYRFEFAAKDRGGDISNIINHSVVIQ